jgi:Tol biopolymer transport system component
MTISRKTYAEQGKMEQYLFKKLTFSILLILILIGCSTGSNPSPMPTIFPSPAETFTSLRSLEPTTTLSPSATPQPVFDGRIVLLNGSRKYTEVAILDLKTSQIQNINNVDVDRAFDALSWSPDGQWIAVGGMFPEFQNARLLIMRPNGDSMNLPSYPHGANPSWSPDGNQIIYNGGSGFAILDVVSGKTYQLTYPTGLEYYPILSPDGSQIAYVYNQKTSTGETFDQQWELWIMNSNGQNSRPIINSLSIMHSPINWSPDGQWIVFVSLDHIENGIANACGDVYIVKPDGSELTRLTNLDECATNAKWSSDGQKIAYIGRNRIRDRDVMKSGWQVYVMDADGDNIVQVTNESEWVLYSLDWEPTIDK